MGGLKQPSSTHEQTYICVRRIQMYTFPTTNTKFSLWAHFKHVLIRSLLSACFICMSWRHEKVPNNSPAKCREVRPMENKRKILCLSLNMLFVAFCTDPSGPRKASVVPLIETMAVQEMTWKLATREMIVERWNASCNKKLSTQISLAMMQVRLCCSLPRVG